MLCVALYIGLMWKGNHFFLGDFISRRTICFQNIDQMKHGIFLFTDIGKAVALVQTVTPAFRETGLVFKQQDL